MQRGKNCRNSVHFLLFSAFCTQPSTWTAKSKSTSWTKPLNWNSRRIKFSASVRQNHESEEALCGCSNSCHSESLTTDRQNCQWWSRDVYCADHVLSRYTFPSCLVTTVACRMFVQSHRSTTTKNPRARITTSRNKFVRRSTARHKATVI